MADYNPGDMDISTQKETYEIFWNWSVRISILCAVIIVGAIAIFG